MPDPSPENKLVSNDSLPTPVAELLEASEKYQLETLKNVCQSLLSTKLEVDNSLKVTKF